jgi:hypothetical protein
MDNSLIWTICATKTNREWTISPHHKNLELVFIAAVTKGFVDVSCEVGMIAFENNFV